MEDCQHGSQSCFSGLSDSRAVCLNTRQKDEVPVIILLHSLSTSESCIFPDCWKLATVYYFLWEFSVSGANILVAFSFLHGLTR